jgi:MFS family permease
MFLANIFTSVADFFPDPARRVKYPGLFFAAFALSSVIGPTLGGWIADNLDWRWVFYTNIPLGLVSLVALPLVLRQSAARTGTPAAAPEADASGDKDRLLACFLRSVEASPSARPNPEEAAALRGVADRIESGNGDCPAVIWVAAGLSGGPGDDERERAAHARKTAISPLAARGADGTR